MKADVLLSEHLGANRLLHCRMGDNELLAVVESAFDANEGSSVILAFPEAKRMWFDHTDGKRIAR